MEYRIIDFAHATLEEIGTFESAYDAVDSILAMSYSNDDRVRHLYIVDSEGTRIFGPTDLYQMRMPQVA